MRASSEREVLALTFPLSGLRTRPTTGGPTLSLSFCAQDFRIEFHFSENEYFTNPILTKLYKVSITYILQPLWSILVHILSTLYSILVHILSTLYSILVHILSSSHVVYWYV